MDFSLTPPPTGALKMPNVIDEVQLAEALAIEAGSVHLTPPVSSTSSDRHSALTHGAPHYVRLDNGPEFVAHAVSDWCRFNSAGSLFIDPGVRAVAERLDRIIQRPTA